MPHRVARLFFEISFTYCCIPHLWVMLQTFMDSSDCISLRYSTAHLEAKQTL